MAVNVVRDDDDDERDEHSQAARRQVNCADVDDDEGDDDDDNAIATAATAARNVDVDEVTADDVSHCDGAEICREYDTRAAHGTSASLSTYVIEMTSRRHVEREKKKT